MGAGSRAGNFPSSELNHILPSALVMSEAYPSQAHNNNNCSQDNNNSSHAHNNNKNFYFYLKCARLWTKYFKPFNTPNP